MKWNLNKSSPIGHDLINNPVVLYPDTLTWIVLAAERAPSMSLEDAPMAPVPAYILLNSLPLFCHICLNISSNLKKDNRGLQNGRHGRRKKLNIKLVYYVHLPRNDIRLLTEVEVPQLVLEHLKAEKGLDTVSAVEAIYAVGSHSAVLLSVTKEEVFWKISSLCQI